MLTTILEYSQLCNFMWMCNEGIYLNVLLSYAVFNSNHKKIIIGFCTIGWCKYLKTIQENIYMN